MATNTTNSFTNHTGNNTAGPFSISFDYLAESEVVVTVGGVTKTQTTHYTFPSATTISFTSGNHPANGAAIKFQRNTNVSSKKVDFQDGSVLTEADLDNNSNQLLYSFQEFLDEGQITEADLLDEDNMASNSATKAATQQSIKAYVDANAGTTNLSNTANGTSLTVESSNGNNTALPAATTSAWGVMTDEDKTKLDGIETSATADQTAAEIRTLVESATDSNVFTDADHTKLNAIEASATADQTNAEIRAAVEAASDSNVFTDADHTKLNAIEASATADQTGAEIKTAYEAESNTNAYTDAEKTKLSGIAASANNYSISSDLLDEDNMASNSATKVPSQQSVKAYVDANSGGSGSTNLSATANGTSLTVESSSGNNVSLPAATTSAWGVMSDDDKTKLDGIEASADVTDATNVNAAGAVMNSDLATKGQILIGDGSGDPSALSVGTNNYVLTADSSEATGVKWAAASGGGATDKISEGNTEAETVDTGSDGHFKVTTEGTERLRVIADGKVGIGTSTPGELLQIYAASGNPTVHIRANNQSTASFKLENDDGAWTISSGTSNYPLKFAVGGSDKFTILNDGKVGIGTTTPSTVLEVNGSFKASSLAYPTSDGSANQVLKTDGSGALSWVDQTTANATHTGEVTGSGALTIADNVVDEANLKVSNSPTNGYFLQAQSGNTGGLTWAAASGGGGPGTGESYVYLKNSSGSLNDSGENVYAGYRSGASLANNGTENTFFGTDSGRYTASGQYNSYFGHRAGENSTTNANVAIGAEALRNNTSGSARNVAIGVAAANAVTSGAYNVAVGDWALKVTTTGSNNVAIGKDSLITNTSGANNTAVGANALDAQTSGSSSVAIGYNAAGAFTSSQVVAVGAGAIAAATTADYTVGVGYNALNYLTSGDKNTAVGFLSQERTTTGGSNTSFGYKAGFHISTGSENTAIGDEAIGGGDCTGSYNVGVGRFALKENTSGESNTALGFQAGNSITTGSNLTCIGYDADASAADATNEITLGNASVTKFRIPGLNFSLKDTTATDNYVLTVDANGDCGWEAAAGGGSSTGETYVKLYASGSLSNTGSTTVAGYYAGNSLASGETENVLIGLEAGKSITTGKQNVVLGAKAGESLDNDYNVVIGADAFKNSTGNSNVAVGHNSLSSTGSNANNVAIGQQALQANTTASGSVAVGYQSLKSNQSGAECVAIGNKALYSNTVSSNIGIGHLAAHDTTSGTGNVAIGAFSLHQNTTSSDNTALGYQALRYKTSGASNTGLGYNAGDSITSGSNNTCIGHDADASAADVSNEITLGNSSIATLRCQVTSITALSDRRDKTDINTLDLGLDFINSLKPVKFKWDSREGIAKDGTYEAGFIAQDFQQVQKDNDADYLGLVLESNPEKLEATPGKLIPILVKAIQELKMEVETLKNNG